MAFDALLTSAEASALFETSALVQRMLDFEAALAWAQADCGQISEALAAKIAACCQGADFDMPALVREARRSGSLAVPLVAQLVQRVTAADPQAAAHVHAGSTSQDVIDTAMVLATRDALEQIDRDLGRLIEGLLDLGSAHLAVPMLARTLMQPAAIQPFGLKAVNWVQPLGRCRVALRAASREALVLQMGGPTGLLGLGHAAERALVQATGRRLGLPVPDSAWHTQRDPWVRLGCELAVLCGSAGKLARDWALMTQAEVGELSWAPDADAGGSSAMPHKRNPVAALVGIVAATRAPLRAGGLLLAMVQEHERALGAWHVELAEWIALVQCAAGSLAALAAAVADLRVDPARMRHHIDAQQGLVFSQAASALLTPAMGRAAAMATVAAACDDCRRDGLHLRDALRAQAARHGRLPPPVDDALDGVFDTHRAIQAVAPQVARAIDALRREPAPAGAGGGGTP